MNQELKQQIFTLCREYEVHEVHPGGRYEIFKDPLSVRMNLATDGAAISFEMTVMNTWTQTPIYTKTVYISDRFRPTALSPDQIDMIDISNAMINKVQQQKRDKAPENPNEYINAMRAITAIQKTFFNKKTK